MCAVGEIIKTSIYFWDTCELFDLSERIKKELEKLLSKDNAFTFYITQLICTDQFMKDLEILKDLQARHPDKDLQITYVQTRPKDLSVLLESIAFRHQKQMNPQDLFDQQIQPLPKSGLDILAQRKRLQKWAIEHTDYLLCDYQRELSSRKYVHFLPLMGKRCQSGAFQVIFLLSDEMLRFVEMQMLHLTEKQQDILHCIGNHARLTDALRQLAIQYAVSEGSICRQYERARLKLRQFVKGGRSGC